MAVSYNMRLITGPTKEPVTLDDVRSHLVIEHAEDDRLISALITGARRHVEARTNSAIVRQKWRVYIDAFCAEIPLGKLPAQEVDSIQYIDGDGATQTVGAEVYELDRQTGTVLLAYGQTWPTPRYQKNAAWVDYWAGHYDPASSPVDILAQIPEDLKIAIKMLVENMYEHRGSASESQLFSNTAFEMLIGPYWVPK